MWALHNEIENKKKKFCKAVKEAPLKHPEDDPLLNLYYEREAKGRGGKLLRICVGNYSWGGK